MKKTDKNVALGMIIVIIGVLVWSIARYTSVKNAQVPQSHDADSTTESPSDESLTQDPAIVTQEQQNVIPLISAQDMNTKIYSQKDDLMIIDMRSRDAFAAGHIKGSYHIDDARLLQAKRTTILVSDNGNEDVLISYYRDLSNSSDVLNLKNGIAGWLQDGHTLISTNSEPNFVNTSKIQYLEPRDIDAMLKVQSDTPKPTIIDTRRSGNFASGHVTGAINIPYAELEYRTAELPRSTQIIVYGANETASFQSGVLLYDLNFTNTITIKGGFEAWEKYGYAIVQ